MGFARSSSFAVGDERIEDDEDGMAIRTEVRVVDRGIEAETRASTAVWRRCGRMVRLCLRRQYCTTDRNGHRWWSHTVLTPVAASSSGKLRICSVI